MFHNHGCKTLQCIAGLLALASGFDTSTESEEGRNVTAQVWRFDLIG